MFWMENQLRKMKNDSMFFICANEFRFFSYDFDYFQLKNVCSEEL